MFERSKFDHTLFGIVLFTVVSILIVVLWVTSSGEGPQSVSNEYETSEYKVNADSRIEATCGGLNGSSLAECKIDIEQSERENHRAQKDLRAQRWMAIWAFVVAGSAIGTLIVTAVGLTWIKATLDETRRAVNSADDAVTVTREIGQAQIRAHLHIEIIDASVSALSVEGSDCIKAIFRCKIHNAGNSPASRVKVLYDIYKSEVGAILEVNTDGSELPASHDTMASIPSNGFVFVELKRQFAVDLDLFKSGKAFVGLSYVLKCTDIFGIEVYEPLVAGSFKEHPPNSGSYVFAQAKILGKQPDN